MDKEHYLEAYEILTELSQKEMKINKEFGTYGGEITYFHWTRLNNVDEFPILKKELPDNKVTLVTQAESTRGWNEQLKQWNPDIDLLKQQESTAYHNTEIDNLRDYFQVLEKYEITHLMLDRVMIGHLINEELRVNLRDIFIHENEYPFLLKEYDSKENGFNYHIKLFRINYDLYNEWVNEK
jgi:hypothetical protein